MTGESLASAPHASAHRAALAATANDPVADYADVRNPVSVIERVNAYGMHADVVPFAHGDILLQAAGNVSRDDLLPESA